MKLHVWGTDFRRSDSAFRQKLYIPVEKREAALRDLMAQSGLHDVVYLATCNRIEFYTSASSFYECTREKWERLLGALGLPEQDFYRGYHLEGKSALRHLLRVASSLESLVLGEPQILGQLKDAYRFAKDKSFPLGPCVERAFTLAFAVAKEVRTDTPVGAKPVNVAALALRRLESMESQYPLEKVVVVGRSPMSRTVIQWMKKNRPSVPLLWVNRSVEKLQELTEAEGLELGKLEDFLRSPGDFSHLFTATSASEPVFLPEFFGRLDWKQRLVFDFAEPQDVWIPEGCTDYPVELVRLENLEKEARANRESRRQAVRQAQGRIDRAIRDHFHRAKQAPVLRDFNTVELKFLEELERAVEALSEDFSQELQQKIHRWGEKLVKKNLHNSREHLRLILTEESPRSKDDPIPTKQRKTPSA